MKHILFTLLLLIVSPAALPAQGGGDPSILKGARVAVYVSSRNFSYDDNYLKFLTQFVRAEKGEEAVIEDIKVQTLIQIGSLFSAQLANACGADSVFFLNEQPQMAREFMQSYNADDHSLKPPGNTFDSLDYILVVNPLVLGSFKRAVVYTRSNRIITDFVLVKTGRLRFDLYDAETGLLREIFEACMDEESMPSLDIQMDFHNETSKTGLFLSKLFSLGVLFMNTGVKGNCGTE